MLRRRPAPIVSRVRSAVFGLALALGILPALVPFLPDDQRLREGDAAGSTLEAIHGAQYESEPLTRLARDAAAAAVQEVPLPPDPAARQAQADQANRLLEQVRTIRQRQVPESQRLAELNAFPAARDLSAVGKSALLELDPVIFDTLQGRTARAIGDLLNKQIRDSEMELRITEYLDDPFTAPATTAERTVLRELLRAFVVPTYRVDQAATDALREEARRNVRPQVVTWTSGQVIVAQGDRLDAADIDALRATGVLHDGFDFYGAAAGLLFAAGFGIVIGVYTYQFQPFPPGPYRRMVLVALMTIGALAAIRLAVPTVTPDREEHYFAFALPIAAAAMVAASFSELQFAAILAVLISLAGAFAVATSSELPGTSFLSTVESLELAIAYSAGGLAGAAAVYRAERLGRYVLGAIAVSVATFTVLVLFWLISEPRSQEALAWLSIASVTAGLGSAVLALGLFVVLSMLFGVTTRLQLLELAQGGHPLLSRLQEEAPGTYHHSMMVGAIAERAAQQIGADALLVRAGAYYHDVGKLARPAFYIENQLESGESPHDDLSPEESAEAIRTHVRAGLEIARRYRLPQAVKDFIPQHHGTRLVTYFYRRAVQTGESVDPSAFRYAGPLPQTKEAAIVMLADSCEAIVRANQDRTRPNMEQLIDGVFAERLAEGQMDECDITMREIQQVATSFKATLRAIYHPRIEYPAPGPEEVAQLVRPKERPVGIIE